MAVNPMQKKSKKFIFIRNGNNTTNNWLYNSIITNTYNESK